MSDARSPKPLNQDSYRNTPIPILRSALVRIHEKARRALEEDSGKWAIQALNDIEEIAEKAIAKTESTNGTD